MYKVLITNAVPQIALQPLAGIAEIIQGPAGGRLMPRETVLRHAPTLHGIINQAELTVDAELLDVAPRLRVVANVAIGVNNLDLKLMEQRGVWATNVPDAFVASTADCTLALILNLMRGIKPADQYVRSGRWQNDGFQPGIWDGALLAGKTLGIVGYGRIGKAVARRAKAFDMRVIFHSGRASADKAFRTLDDLLTEADVVTLHTPLTASTHHLIDAKKLAQMKSKAFLINMARGPVVHEQALVDALLDGKIAGAALDVFEFEPEVHPALLQMPNVCLTPHIGGGTRESRMAARHRCAENVAAALRGERPTTPVNNPRDRAADLS
ncbi:MAG: D-glycerate dehydrogenase [Chloroflexota bacterium]|nr:D-glycerate dehydrogenase [Chloroflexota bacterium]MDE2908686.1 D-glycerate dehydrogenase [Chloroflexota bacterium]